jgi:hypothetical protein
MSDWERITPKWIQTNQEDLMEEGLRVQAAARFLIRRLGYNIVKSEEDVPSPRQVSLLEGKVGRHLARYSDYIVKMSRRIYVIDVKAKQFSSPLASNREKILMFTPSIFLKRNYVDTIARVLVLAVLYPVGLFVKSNVRGKKVYYGLSSTQGSPTAEGGVEIVLDQNFSSYRWVKAKTFRRWISATKGEAQRLIQMHPLR